MSWEHLVRRENVGDTEADGAVLITMHRDREKGSLAIEVTAAGDPEPTYEEIRMVLDRASWLFRGQQ